MWTHDFSRASFAVDLSTNLVHNSIFVIDYDYRDMLSIGRDPPHDCKALWVYSNTQLSAI